MAALNWEDGVAALTDVEDADENVPDSDSTLRVGYDGNFIPIASVTFDVVNNVVTVHLDTAGLNTRPVTPERD